MKRPSGVVVRGSSALPSGGRVHTWVGDHWCVFVAKGTPTVVPPRLWTAENAGAFADAMAEAALLVEDRAWVS